MSIFKLVDLGDMIRVFFVIITKRKFPRDFDFIWIVHLKKKKKSCDQ